MYSMTVFILGIVCGVVGVGVLMVAFMPKMGRLFFVVDQSGLPFEETINQIRERCKTSEHWILQAEKDYNAAYIKNGSGEMPHRLVEFKLGNPDHSYRVNRVNPEVSTFMPAALAIVEYTPEKVLIYRKNTGIMGKMFNEPMRTIMGVEVPQQLDELLKGIIVKS